MRRGFWDRVSAANPYYVVESRPENLGRTLDDASLARFFQTGVDHVDALWKTIEQSFGLNAGFRPQRALDFGCGVGRITLAMAARCDQVLGVDIAASMVAKGQEHAAACRPAARDSRRARLRRAYG